MTTTQLGSPALNALACGRSASSGNGGPARLLRPVARQRLWQRSQPRTAQMHHLRQPPALRRGGLQPGLRGSVGGREASGARGCRAPSPPLLLRFTVIGVVANIESPSSSSRFHHSCFFFPCVFRAQGEEGVGKRSVLDMDPEVQAIMEMTGKTLHSQGLREPEEDQDD